MSKYYATCTHPAAYGMPEKTEVYYFESRGYRDYFVKNGGPYDYNCHPRPICAAVTAKEARALAPVDDYGDRYAIPDPYGSSLDFYPWGSPKHDAFFASH